MGVNRRFDDEKKLKQRDQFFDETQDYKDYEEGYVTGFMEEKPMQSGVTNSFDVSSDFVLVLQIVEMEKQS